MATLLCPLCSQPRFDNLESLRVSLVHAATQNIACPICNEVLLGLDKLTIHLFGHTVSEQGLRNPDFNVRHVSDELATATPTTSQPVQTTNSQLDILDNANEKMNLFLESDKMKFENSQMDLDDTLLHFNSKTDFVTESGQTCESEVDGKCDVSIEVKDSCTVNMEDLAFLTSWENSIDLKYRDKLLRDEMEKVDSNATKNDACLWNINTTDLSRDYNDSNDSDKPTNEETKEENTELSEYMSDLLNKKLPILNFIYYDENKQESESLQQMTEATESFVKEERRPNEKIRCGFCGFIFPNHIILSMHQELVHSKLLAKYILRANGDETKKVSLDNRSSSTVQSYETKTTTDLRNIPPGNDINDNNTYETVNQKSAEDDISRYSCHLCSKTFKMRGSLMLHYRVAHFGINVPVALPFVASSPPPTEERTFHCSICPKSFKKEQHLTQHIKTHDGKQWQCDICSKHFTTKYFLKKHQRLHTGEMPYCCSTCKKTFTFQQSYHKHLLYHSDDKPHECSECGRSFKELSTLHNHQRIHSGEKPFACQTCGKSFRQRVSYIVHQRIHTGVLPYQCTACKKKFRYKVSQRSHKCPSQPPGVVVRQSSDLIQRILEQRNTILQSASSQ